MINNDDLLKELSFKELTELSDLKGNFKLNQEVVDDAKDDALAFIGSFFSIPSNPTPLLKQICTLLTIIELKRKQNFPKDSYKDELKYCEDLLIKMANSRIPKELNDLNKENAGVINKSRAFRHGGVLQNWDGING